MILKALKVLPFLAGSFNAPVLDNPKRANNDTPINTVSGNIENDSETLTYRTWMLNDLGEETSVKRVSTSYQSLNTIDTNFGILDMHAFSEDYYTLNTSISNKPIILEDNTNLGKTNYHSIYLQALRINNVEGFNKIYLENYMNIYPQMWMHSYSNVTLNIKWTGYINIGNEGLEYYNTDIETTSLNYMVNDMQNNIRIQKWFTYSTTIDNLNYSTNKAQSFELTTDQDYIINEGNSSEYYIFLLTEVWRNQNVQIPYFETAYIDLDRPLQNTIISNQNLCYYEYYTYATTLVQEVVDIPNMMFTILTMPFSFISQAFNLTLFPNTQYSINVSNLFLVLIAILIFAFVMKLILGFIK